MAFLPDALDFALERAVEAVVVDFLIFDEGVLRDELAEALRVDEIVFDTILLLAARGA